LRTGSEKTGLFEDFLKAKKKYSQDRDQNNFLQRGRIFPNGFNPALQT
jgi:hypothetical protein